VADEEDFRFSVRSLLQLVLTYGVDEAVEVILWVYFLLFLFYSSWVVFSTLCTPNSNGLLPKRPLLSSPLSVDTDLSCFQFPLAEVFEMQTGLTS